MLYKSSKGVGDVISKKIFSLNDQVNFANFSGDRNPIHVDKIAARRTLNGQCIVHGMHSFLWALDSLAKENGITGSKIRVYFRNPIFLEEEVYCVWNEQDKRLSILTNEITFATIDLEIKKITPNNEIHTPIENSRKVPDEITFLKCSKLSNQPFKIFGDVNLANRLFPSFSDFYGIATACEIGAISQIVGMECPGLHSLFVSLTIELTRKNTTPVFGVLKSDERFGLLNILAEGNAVVAQIGSLYRPTPSKNPHISEVAALVKDNEFKNSRALIIGGSRGIGEVVAKLISAGGGDPTITYHVGKTEAERVVNEIRTWGGKCEIVQLTINEKQSFLLDYSSINQLYYFASPKILGRRTENYDEKMLSLYRTLYVDCFNNICNEIISRNFKCSVFYPSTVFIDNQPPDLENYVQAKIEGETLCKVLNENAVIDIIAPRLPRFSTDQNQTIIKEKYANISEILIPFIRAMQRY